MQYIKRCLYAASLENKACLQLPGTGIGRNGSLPGTGGFADGFSNETTFLKFLHLKRPLSASEKHDNPVSWAQIVPLDFPVPKRATRTL
jgi:hypothetical protein